MKTRLLVSPLSFAIVLFSAVVTVSAQAQATPSPSPTPEPTVVDVVYTGRLLGYFRTPSRQNFNEIKGCPAGGESSAAAIEFFAAQKKLKEEKKLPSVLVGTGDNFGPELEARVFYDATLKSSPSPSPTEYKARNKELFVGAPTGWLHYTKLTDPLNKDLKKRIDGGLGTIPNDNVACFLRRAGFAAVVPGKHDFYFGAERVRQLARFLAAEKSGEYESVQMLGANLVMMTAPIETKAVSPKVKADRLFDEWPSAYTVMNLTDGKSVYPWFSTIKIKLIEFSRNASLLPELKKRAAANGVITKIDEFISETKTKLKSGTPETADQRSAELKDITTLETNLGLLTGKKGVRICKAEKEGTPNQLPADLSTCDEPRKTEIRLVRNSVVLYAYLKKKFETASHFSTLEYGQNFGLCTEVPNKDKKPNSKEPDSKNACMRFSSYTPLFYFPHKVPNEIDDGYKDPEPYVIKNNVAIFGLVEPTLGEQVGALNFGWRHDDNTELTTRVSVEDPADALQQQLDYFEVQQENFNGLKVLLAQMTPQRARALAARFPEFQVIVSAADQEQGTSNVKMSTSWKPDPQAPGQFLAVPTPYFNSSTREGSVHMGVITANPSVPKKPAQETQSTNATQEPSKTTWELSAAAQPGKEVEDPDDEAKYFWSRIKEALPACLPPHFTGHEIEERNKQTYLKWLVLCAMQQHLGTDVALIQTRDLFEKIPKLDERRITRSNRTAADKEPTDPKVKEAEFRADVQQTLDRLIWKGDLVTFLLVPGSALKKALAQSDNYTAAESATLSLSVDRGRKLETLGIRKNDAGEYFIHELPIEDNRVYSVATTDYIGAGDTGYPDLVKAARNPRTHPAAFTGELITISSLVCQRLFNNEPDMKAYCLPAINSDLYLDTTIAQQIPPYPGEGWFSRVWPAAGIALPQGRKKSLDPSVGLEQKVQRRSFLGFSLKNFSIGIKDLDNNRTDDSLKEHFAGVPTSGVNSQENRTLSLGVDARLSYFADKHEFFLDGGIDYERYSQGDPPVAKGISLNRNKVFASPGVVWWRRPGREQPNVGAVASVYVETQLEAPFSVFTLKTPAADQLRIPQKRGLLVMGRLGVRWQNKSNAFEIGGQWGKEFRALEKYHFENPGGTPVDCRVDAVITVTACIEKESTPPDGRIVSSSIPSAVLQRRPRAGMYWKHTFSFPISPRLKYEATQDADFFFKNFDSDTSIDTRFRHNFKNRLSLMVWPNFSIGPTFDLFMYQNKGDNRSFLFQRSFGFETKLNFDIFNRRERKAQIKARP